MLLERSRATERLLRADLESPSVLTAEEWLWAAKEDYMRADCTLRSIVIYVRRVLRCPCTSARCITGGCRWRSLCEHDLARLQTTLVTSMHGNMYPSIIAIDYAQFGTTRWSRSEAIKASKPERRF